MFLASGLKGYTVLDTGDGEKLEDVGGIILQRPDPQAIWEKSRPDLWRPHAVYERSNTGGGKWRFLKKVPERWTIELAGLKFYVRPTGFKHIGVFPEQAANWEYIRRRIAESGRKVSVLNLFAYTGGATLASLSAGASVVHVDAAKSMNEWAKENARLSGLADGDVRFIADDCHKFVLREQRRGRRYDAIVMDPPSYGRSDSGVWKIEQSLYPLVKDCAALLTDDPLFFIINSYTTGLAPGVLSNVLRVALSARGGRIEAAEVGLPVERANLVLPCGASGRWTRG